MITFDYNPETNEYKALKQEIIKDKGKNPVEAAAVAAKDSSEPQLTLTDNKYILNESASEVMGAKWEDRLNIQYQIVNGVTFPIIGKNTAWGNSTGNKLTKALTVSCRGTANDLLKKYGDIFSITPWKDHEGLFVLIGDKYTPNEQSDEVEITEPQETEVDIEEKVDVEQEDDLLSEDDYDFEIKNMNFELN